MGLLGGVGGVTPPIFLKLQERWSKVGHASIEVGTVYSVTFFISNSILLLIVVDHIEKHPLPRKVSRRISARRQLTSFGIVMQKQWRKSIRRKFVCR